MRTTYGLPIFMMVQNLQSKRGHMQVNSDYSTNMAAKKKTNEFMERLDTIEIEKLGEMITLLSREDHITADIQQGFLHKAAGLGFDIDKLEWMYR
jgi:uncharacterized membrane protein